MKNIKLAVVLLATLVLAVSENLWAQNDSAIKLAFTGDNFLDGKMVNRIEECGPTYPYKNVAKILRQSDIVFGNLESPLTNCQKPTSCKSIESIMAGRNFIFKTPPKYARILKETGFNLVSLANNHLMDYKACGLNETIETLKKAGITYVGAGKNIQKASSTKIINLRGCRIGFLAYSMIVPACSAATNTSAGINSHAKQFDRQLYEAIHYLKEKVDLVVIALHWGIEKDYLPTEYQRNIAHCAVDAGADIIIGSHPHRIQGIELYKNGVVAYSLGNFLFAGGSHQVESLILQISLEDCRIKNVEAIPILVEEGRPEPTNNFRIIEKIESVSQPFGTKFKKQKGRLIVTK